MILSAQLNYLMIIKSYIQWIPECIMEEKMFSVNNNRLNTTRMFDLICMMLVYMWPYVAAHIKCIALIPWHEVKNLIPQFVSTMF